MQDLVIPPDVLAWLQKKVAASDRSERAARDQVRLRYEEDIKRLKTRLEIMYLDKPEGRVSATFFDEKATQRCEQQQRRCSPGDFATN